MMLCHELIIVSLIRDITSRKRLHTKVTPDLHLTYSINGGNLGLVLKRQKVVISP